MALLLTITAAPDTSKITLIKAIRSVTGLGLVEAKNSLDYGVIVQQDDLTYFLSNLTKQVAWVVEQILSRGFEVKKFEGTYTVAVSVYVEKPGPVHLTFHNPR